jgi:putative membrane-bound dehydrogenase-like protein
VPSSNFKKSLKVASLTALAALIGWMALVRVLDKKRGEQAVSGLAGIHVPPGFTVEQVAGPGQVSYPMLAVLDDRGRLFVTESSGKNISGEAMAKNPECRIRLLEDLDGDGIYERSKIFAEKLTLPMGALWYRGSLYVASPPDFLRLDDADGDGVSERREVILTGWNVHNTASLHGPFLGPDGWLYLTHGRHGYKIQTKEGKLLEGLASRIWRCRPDGSGLERVCGGGFDNPVELVFTPAGEMIGTMTYYVDPQNGQRDALMHFVEGGVYPKPHPAVSEFKRTGNLMPVMSKFARIAPAGLMQYRGTNFGPGYQGNLFSAQFNPHRIQRHILFREGATFRTQDEDFVTSSDPDFHPTDIFEDADGSLIFLDTGAWYVDACPLSRISKSDRTGAIYRIRKAGAPRTVNPRGEDLKLQRLAPADLARHLEDPRPAVRDRSSELLVEAGEVSVAPLDQVRQRAASAETRCAAVFALGRISVPGAESAVRAALSDSGFEVRAAAAHMVGMVKDREAVSRLMEMVRKDEPAVRLAAATALGQIGDAQAATALLAASVDLPDRFVEHAVIYALIQLKDPVAVVRALKQPETSVRKAALITLDQMDGTPLKRDQALTFLADANPELRRAALWVVSHHPDWAGSVVELLRARLRASQLADDEADSIREVLLAFCADPQVQKMIADLLGDSAVSPERRLFLLNAIDRSSLKEVPAAWTQEFTKQLRDPDARVRARVIGLIRSRGIRGLDQELERISSDQKESADLRVAALGALVLHHTPLEEASVQFLLSQLQPSTEAALRLSAAQVLGQAQLSDPQLLQLANRYLPQSDALILSTLLDAFRSCKSEEVSRALVAALLKPTLNLSSVDNKRLEQLLQNLPPPVQAAAQPLRVRFQKEQAARVQRLKKLQFFLTAGGDVGRGRSIFFGKKVACSSCHTIGAEGGHVGPDLTSIGSIRSGHDLLEAIVFPSASFVPGHEVFRVKTKNSPEVLSGVMGEQETDAVILVTGPNAELRIPRDQIALMERSAVSLMPDGLDTSLTQVEFTDLLAFLQAQR